MQTYSFYDVLKTTTTNFPDCPTASDYRERILHHPRVQYPDQHGGQTELGHVIYSLGRTGGFVGGINLGLALTTNIETIAMPLIAGAGWHKPSETKFSTMSLNGRNVSINMNNQEFVALSLSISQNHTIQEVDTFFWEQPLHQNSLALEIEATIELNREELISDNFMLSSQVDLKVMIPGDSVAIQGQGFIDNYEVLHTDHARCKSLAMISFILGEPKIIDLDRRPSLEDWGNRSTKSKANQYCGY